MLNHMVFLFVLMLARLNVDTDITDLLLTQLFWLFYLVLIFFVLNVGQGSSS